MTRNILVLAMAAVMAMSFTACGRRNGNEGEVSQSPSPAATASPTPDIEPTEKPSPEVELENSATLEEFRDAVKKSYGGGYLPDRELTETEIMNLTGISKDMYEEAYAEMTEDESVPDVFMAVKAKKGMADDVREKLEIYKSQMEDKYIGDEFADKLGAARVYQNGDYVFLMLLGDDTEPTEGETAMDGMGEAMENVGDRLKKSADKAIEAIEELIGA